MRLLLIKPMKSKKLIIPAAGFGRRMGSPPAKELLLGSQGFPMIEFALGIGRKLAIPSLVIVRREKTELIDYLQKHPMFALGLLQLQEIEPSAEWSATVLASQKSWVDHNLLVLPDTEFAPIDIVEKMFSSSKSIQAAVFEVKDPKNWGVIQNIQAESFEIADKPENLEVTRAKAWGLLGFDKNAGEVLFQSILGSFLHGKQEAQSSFQRVPLSLEEFSLDCFFDLGRKN